MVIGTDGNFFSSEVYINASKVLYGFTVLSRIIIQRKSIFRIANAISNDTLLELK